MYHCYVCFVCSVTVFCGSSKLPFCVSVHCILLSLIHMLPRHFGVYLCCFYRPFVSVAFTGMKVWSVLGWWCDLSVHLLQQTAPHKETTPSYARIRIPKSSPAHKHTQQRVTTMRIKDEIKYLHCKKQKLNSMTYQLHLQLANTWTGLWPHIQYTIEGKHQKECRLRYQAIDNKLGHLTQQQTNQPPPPAQKFYPRVVNLTDIIFPEPEMTLLQKGPCYRKDPNTTYRTNPRTGFKTSP